MVKNQKSVTPQPSPPTDVASAPAVPPKRKRPAPTKAAGVAAATVPVKTPMVRATAVKKSATLPAAPAPIPDPAPPVIESPAPPVVTSPPRRRKTTAAALSPEERYKMVQDAAYYRAEKRGFAPGHEAEDWAAAEREVEALLRQRKNQKK